MSQNETIKTRDFMLTVARTAIESRAVLDDYQPGDYDGMRDPDGYVVSLLNALHHWCHRNGIDWDKEVQFAENLFLEDIGVPETPPTVEGLSCPACGHVGSFYTESSEVSLRYADGAAVFDDSQEQWGNGSYCSCHACGYAGRVYQFRKDFPKAKEDTPDGRHL